MNRKMMDREVTAVQLIPTKPKILSDRVIALGMLARSAAAAQALCNAATAASSPDLKRLYKEYLQETYAGLEALETYILDKRWLNPFASPEDQLRAALEHADEFVAERT